MNDELFKHLVCPTCSSDKVVKNGIGENEVQRFRCKECGRRFRETTVDPDILKENVRLSKRAQRFMDSNRIERKSFREYARIDNAVTEFNRELVELLKEYNLADKTELHNSDNGRKEAAAVVHFTDSHFNELVALDVNSYDFSIASKRCKKFISRVKEYLSVFNVKNVLFAMTGDLLNSDRRLDELLAQATNRSKAVFLSVEILQQMLLDLNKDFNVSVACVTGNESRISKERGWIDLIATDNYDFTIFNILDYIFRGSVGITFIKNTDPTEQVVNVGGQNVLLIHGHQINTGKVETSIQTIIGKYMSKGVSLDLVIYGHMHSCRIGDTYARGSSVVGANAYSERGLQLISRASQNVHIIFDKDCRDSIRIDLQNTDGIYGYDINKELEAYNCKSADRLHKPVVIFKVTI